MSVQTDVRPSALAGRWYPADPDELAHNVDGYLTDAQPPEIPGEIIGVVSPHAGHQYSGPVAGYAFAVLKSAAPELVVILSPMHQPARAPLLTTSHQAYRTPLGEVAVNRQMLIEISDKLQETEAGELTEISRDQEHSVEILIPFLQRALEGKFQILPIMLRRQSPEVAEILADVLAEQLAGKNALLVASTDLSHFYTSQEAEQLDQRIIQEITAFNPDGIYQAEEEGKGYACGKGALAAAIWAAQKLGANHAEHLKYSHSGDVTGNHSRVVGYEAAVLTRR